MTCYTLYCPHFEEGTFFAIAEGSGASPPSRIVDDHAVVAACDSGLYTGVDFREVIAGFTRLASETVNASPFADLRQGQVRRLKQQTTLYYWPEPCRPMMTLEAADADDLLRQLVRLAFEEWSVPRHREWWQIRVATPRKHWRQSTAESARRRPGGAVYDYVYATPEHAAEAEARAAAEVAEDEAVKRLKLLSVLDEDEAYTWIDDSRDAAEVRAHRRLVIQDLAREVGVDEVEITYHGAGVREVLEVVAVRSASA